MLFARSWSSARTFLVNGVRGLMLVALWGPAELLAQAPRVDLETVPTRVDSIHLAEHPEGVELAIVGDGQLKWSIRDPGDGELIVLLRNCRPGAASPELRPEAGLVESVTVGDFGTAEDPQTRVAIRARQKIKYRVADGERSVTVLLIPRQPPPEVEPSTPHVEPPPPHVEPPTPHVEPPPPEVEPPTPEVAEPLTESPTAFEPPTESPTPPPLAARAGDYRVGAGDVLAIDVFGLDEMDRKVRVQRDGTISLPLLGASTVLGLSLEDAELLIAEMLRDRELVREPQVSIFVDELVSRAVNVQGAVVRPGIYQLIGNKTLLELIGEAGGLTENSGASILVLRTESGQERKMDLDLRALVAGENHSLNVSLLPGDKVMVPFSRELTVYVTGAVQRPGPVLYQSSDGITVLQAIIAAGGPTPRANLKKAHVLRKAADGGQERIAVNIKKIQSGRMDDLLLERNDTVVIGEWFF